MIRRHLLSLAVILSAGALGCAHCDTCSDFPGPGNAPAYGGSGPSVFGAARAIDAVPTSMTTPINDAAPAAPEVMPTPPASPLNSAPAAPIMPPKPSI